MITGSTPWTNALNGQQKQPLYYLEIAGFPDLLASFVASAVGVTAPMGKTFLPYLQIPQGVGQQIDELEGHSSISQLEISCIDPNNELKAISANAGLIGAVAKLWMGFPGGAVPADFVTLHVGRIQAVGRSAEGLMTISIGDLIINLINTIFLNGGPAAWSTGDPTNPFPAAPPAVADNSVPISTDNPRYLSENPMNLLLAILQNELGIGQTLAPVVVVDTQGGSGTGRAGFGINPGWQFFDPMDDSTLINPNPYIDVPGILALRDAQFSGERMEFALSNSVTGKTWIEDQILKPLGLFWVTRANGQISLKSMKHPPAPATVALTARNIIGIPGITRWPVVNMIDFSVIQGEPGGSDKITYSFVNQDSIAEYRAPYQSAVDSDGLRPGYGAGRRAFLYANRVFARHGFGTPEYSIETFLENLVLEIGDFILLTHPLVLDLKGGTLGVTSVVCEIVGREPNYSGGGMIFKAIDTRFISAPPKTYKVAATIVPAWTGASAPQKAAYLFISNAGGQQSDGATANVVS